MNSLKYDNSNQTKYGTLMLAAAIIAVTTVGVSTAQVVNTLSVELRGPTLLEAAPEMVTDLEVTLETIPMTSNKMLILENVNDKALSIRHLNYELLSRNARNYDGHLDGITLKPNQSLSLVIDGPSTTHTGHHNRLVKMKGRVVGGHLVLMGL